MENNLINYKFSSQNFIFQVKKDAISGITNFKKHIHPCYEIMFFDDGEVEFAIEDRVYVAKKGDVLLIKPCKYHCGKRVNLSPYSRFCLILSPEIAFSSALVEKIFLKGEKISLGENSLAFRLIRTIYERLSDSEEYADEFSKGIIDAILISLENSNPETNVRKAECESTSQKVINFVNMHINSINSVEDISRALFLSRSYIMHIFKAEFKMGVMQYVRNKKLLMAHMEISKGKKPTEVYQECGFSNYPTFYRAYLAYFGASPKNARDIKLD